jgi:hypothetical protein
VHFGGRAEAVDARTFAQAILGLTEALRTINREINPGYDLDVEIDAIGHGSFRARLRTVKRSIGNIFSSKGAEAIVVSVLGAIIYDLIKPENPPQVHVHTDAVIIEHGGKAIVVPKAAMEAKKRVETNTPVRRQVAETVEVLQRDPEISSFGITRSLEDPEPDIEIPRALFPVVVGQAQLAEEEERERTTEVDAELTVIKAILQRSSRKWEFIWNGIRISAPISDESFFDRLTSGAISLHHGDSFIAVLRIRQVRDSVTGAWVNVSYEVMKVPQNASAAPDRLDRKQRHLEGRAGRPTEPSREKKNRLLRSRCARHRHKAAVRAC